MIAAVLLAAGGSRRLGRPKQLVQYRGATLVRRARDAPEEKVSGKSLQEMMKKVVKKVERLDSKMRTE